MRFVKSCSFLFYFPLFCKIVSRTSSLAYACVSIIDQWNGQGRVQLVPLCLIVGRLKSNQHVVHPSNNLDMIQDAAYHVYLYRFFHGGFCWCLLCHDIEWMLFCL